MMTSSAMICETESLLNEHHFAESELDSEFGVRNHEGDASNPSFSTDVSDEEDFSSGDEDDMENGKKRKHDDGPKTKDQLDRRRERNRVLARKTRLRKKSFFEALQKQVAQLAVENDMLKGIVRQRLGAPKTVSLVQNAPLGSAEVALSTSRANAILENADHSLMTAIQAAQRSYVISDPALPDNPIIFASKGFLDLSGYTLENALGRNCRFLQGPGTDLAQVEILKEGIKAGKDTSVCLLNYRADGTPFFNQIFIAAIRDKSNAITNYVGVQVEMKSLLSPNSCVDIEDLGLNKVPKKGRPRTRELKEPKPPKIKEPKEQKPKVASLTKSQSQKLSQRLLNSNSNSNPITEKKSTKEDKIALNNVILNIPSLELNSPRKPEHAEGDVFMKEECHIISTDKSTPEYPSDTMSSLFGLRSFSAFAAAPTHPLQCQRAVSDTSGATVTSRSNSQADLKILSRTSSGTGATTVTGTCTPVTDCAVGTTQIRATQSTDSLQVIDDLFFMFDRDDNEVGEDYTFQFGGEARNTREDNGMMGDTDMSTSMGDEGWNF